jgi:hypothetical protein
VIDRMIRRAHLSASASLARRLGVAVALVAAAWTVGAVAPSEVAAASCGPAPSGKLAVHVVVDRGSGSPVRHCVLIAPGRDGTGLRVLQANHSVRLEGGFVCAIDGAPATGCATNPATGTAYWSYWHAAPGGSWVYSTVGAGGYRLSAPCSIEGWTWSSSPGAARPPRADPRSLDCNPAPPPTPAPPPATTPPASGPVGSNGQSDGGPDASTPRTTGSTGTDGSRGAEPMTAIEPAGAQPTTTVPGDEGADDRDDAGAAEGSDAEAGSDDRDVDGRDGADDGDGDGDRNGDAAEGGEGSGELASAPGPDGSGGPPWGVLVAGVLVLTLGGAAAVRSRRREAPAS